MKQPTPYEVDKMDQLEKLATSLREAYIQDRSLLLDAQEVWLILWARDFIAKLLTESKA